MPESLAVLPNSVESREMSWAPADFFERVGEKIRCELCPLNCLLKDGDTGFCRVRRRRGDRMETATFASSVLHLDSIERKPLYHFRPGLKVLTISAPGCTFTCDYCQNHRISQFGRESGVGWSASPITPEAVVERVIGTDLGIAFSYSEPALAAELALAIHEALGHHTNPIVWKTNGFLTERARSAMAAVLSAANIDLKCASSGLHMRLTGAPAEPVIETIRQFTRAGIWVEVSTPLIPGWTADRNEIRAIAETIAGIDPDIPWHLLRVSPDYRLHANRPTAVQEIQAAQEIGVQAGLRYIYVERAFGPRGRSTNCARCGVALIERGIWTAGENRIAGGRCPACGAALPGRW